MVNQDPAHDPRRDAEKVGTTLPVDGALIDQPKEGLVHHRGRLQGVRRTLPAHEGRGEPMELSIKEFGQPFSSFRLSRTISPQPEQK